MTNTTTSFFFKNYGYNEIITPVFIFNIKSIKSMRKIIIYSFLTLFIILSSFSASVEARTIKVKSYYKPSSMKYVAPSYRTSPNKTKLDNYSTRGNYNPYTGKKGTLNPYAGKKGTLNLYKW